MSRKQKKATPESSTHRVLFYRTDTIMDMRRCSKCKYLYGYSPYRQGSEEGRPRLRHGETKWCPKCEEPHVVLLIPMLWRGVLLVLYRYPRMIEALEMADRLGIGLPVEEKPDTRSDAERLQAIGMEVAS